jgi:hypothetical protein
MKLWYYRGSIRRMLRQMSITELGFAPSIWLTFDEFNRRES